VAEHLRREGLAVENLPRDYDSFRTRPWQAFNTCLRVVAYRRGEA
jgi:hypothetical protein